MVNAEPTTGPKLTRVGQIHIPVTDLARAVDFYRNTLGMTFLFEVPRMAFFDCGGIRLMLGTPEDGAAALTGTILYYQVEDIHASFASVEARGAAVLGKPHFVATLATGDLWMAFLRDSEGNTFALMSEVKA